MVGGILPDCVWRSLQLMTFVMSYQCPPFYLSVGPAGAWSPSMPADLRLSNWANRAAVRTVQQTGKGGFHPTVSIFLRRKIVFINQIDKSLSTVSSLSVDRLLCDSSAPQFIHKFTRTRVVSLQQTKAYPALYKTYSCAVSCVSFALSLHWTA